MEQKSINNQTRDAALKILDTIRDTNLNNASAEEKRNLIAQMGIKVYPSEDGKELRISSNLQFKPSPIDFSTQIISMASPKLKKR